MTRRLRTRPCLFDETILGTFKNWSVKKLLKFLDLVKKLLGLITKFLILITKFDFNNHIINNKHIYLINILYRI